MYIKCLFVARKKWRLHKSIKILIILCILVQLTTEKIELASQSIIMAKRMLLLSVFIFSGCTSAYDFFDPTAFHFPIQNVQQSINLSTFSASQYNLTVGKCEHVTNDRVVLNLANLDIYPPPNPYPGFIQSSIVTCLNLASNEIFQIVPGSFEQVPNLSYLDLSKNRIQFCDFFNIGSPHPNLVTLVIEDNKPPVDNIDKTISKADCFPSLRYLYLRRNSIRRLNFSLKRAFPILTHLFLSDNSLDSNDFVRDLPPTLTYMSLERNMISGLDCRIMKDLEYLHLDSNIVRSICYRRCQDTSLRLEGVHKLNTLTISNNRITEIESCAFQDALGLMTLNLAQNNLVELKRDTFERLVLLKELNLDDNQLVSVPNLCNNNLLTSLSLKRNKLRTIRRENFKNLRFLKCLRLGGNQIASIEANSFQDLESLVELDLSYNGLDFIPSDWFKWQWNLQTLDVRGNKFTCLEKMSLGPAPFLTTIYLQNNPVTQISGSIISKLSPNVVVYLQNDCSGAIRNKSSCYKKCDEDEVIARNETYSRWINNL